jgi:hypothetical protein
MLLYSPSWLYLVPGGILLLLGLAGMLVLASGPVDVLGRSWQIHTMLGFTAATLLGAQIIQFGVLARTYARTHIGELDPLLERLGRKLRLEHGLLAGGVLALGSFAGLLVIFGSWAAGGFGELGHVYATAVLFTFFGLGVQIVFVSFLLALLTMRLRHDAGEPEIRGRP